MNKKFFEDLDEEKESTKENKSDRFFADLEQDPSRARSLASALPKGVIRGSRGINPMGNLGPIPNKLAEKLLSKFLPTQEKTPEQILEFTGENLPAVAQGGEGLLMKGLQAAGGALLKTGAKEANLPEWAQEVANITGIGVPALGKGLATKGLRPNTKQKPVYDFLKSKGLTDQDIAPIIQDKKKLSILSKAAFKFEKGDPYIKDIKSKISNVYEDIRERGGKTSYLQGNDLRNFENELNEKLSKLQKRHRKLIQSEVEDLYNNPIDFTELHDFKLAINDIVKDSEGGKAAIGILKEPLSNAQKAISPELHSELKLLDKAHGDLKKFTKQMTKKTYDHILSLGPIGTALWGALTFNPTMMTAGGLLFGKVIAARTLAKKMLTNPRFHNMYLKMKDQVSKNNIPKAIKTMRLIEEEAKKSSIGNDEESK